MTTQTAEETDQGLGQSECNHDSCYLKNCADEGTKGTRTRDRSMLASQMEFVATCEPTAKRSKAFQVASLSDPKFLCCITDLYTVQSLLLTYSVHITGLI